MSTDQDKAESAARRLKEHRCEETGLWGRYCYPIPGVPGEFFSGNKDIQTVFEYVLSETEKNEPQ